MDGPFQRWGVLKHSYFMEISAPNYVPYPASDAAYFGLWSESLMAGLGFKDTIVSRQFFVIILAFIQMITHKNMVASIDCLTVFLALIPAVLFLLGKQIHSQGAGLLAAGIAIFRELNTLYLAPLFGVSDSKMFLSDMPALLFFLLFISVCVSWFFKFRLENKINSDGRNSWILYTDSFAVYPLSSTGCADPISA